MSTENSAQHTIPIATIVQTKMLWNIVKSVFGTFVAVCDVVFIILGHCFGALYRREHVVILHIFSSDEIMFLLSLLCYFYVNVTEKCNKNANIPLWCCVAVFVYDRHHYAMAAIRLVAYAE